MAPFHARVLHVPVTESTMDDARGLAESGAPEGMVVRADRQAYGRGRAGRAWSSPPGGLWMTLVLRPRRGAEAWPLLGLVVGSACCAAAERYGVSARVKWPNDVLIDGKKVAGFLLESRLGEFLLVGCGINVTVDRALLPDGTRELATSLHEHTATPLDVEAFLATYLEAFGSRYEAWERGDDEALCEEWRRRALTLGQPVRTESGLTGVAKDIDRQGALLVETADGHLERVAWGDVVRAEVR
ncbi:MAG TPA: biotin--[acetyl-CoA-carboxylase] ligase [Candidatus Thermoplasmatota archaeon]|nr:biotin--[acetyl-CoA-carboxylase] ligase [Candidatus Thermoplasmatota archaeon]